MGEQHQQPLAAKQHIINLVGDQRANNLSWGHFGRISYVPAEENDRHYSNRSGRPSRTGRLYTNRITKSTFSLRELPALTAWYPPTRSTVLESEKDAYKQLAWLWKDSPEAVVGTASLWSSLTKEIKTASSVNLVGMNLPLLDYGEIVDIQSRETASLPVLAMAVGDSGHILRIVQARKQRLHLNPARYLSVSIDSCLANGAEGHWCGSVPIRQIKFVSFHLSNRFVQWVLVQTAAATTTFEPALRLTPVNTKHSNCTYVSRGPANIHIAQAMDIRAEETGGEAHRDAAFNPGSNTTLPQLAIIDEAGNWRVWELQAKPANTADKTCRTLRAKGNLMDEMPSLHSLTGIYERRSLHRIGWLPAVQRQNDVPLPIANASNDANVLVLVNAAFLKTVDVSKQKTLQTFGLTSHNGIDKVLDIQPCPTKPSRVLVLTATTLFWLDLESSLGHPKTPAKASSKMPSKASKKASAKSANTEPVVLLSCPHMRNPLDSTLKLCVASSPLSHRRATSLACIYSTTQAEMTMFWLMEAGWGGQASFRQQTFCLSPTSDTKNKDQKNAKGEHTMVMLPQIASVEDISSRRLRRQKEWPAATQELSVFQFIRQGPDLGVHSSVCLCSSAVEWWTSLSVQHVQTEATKHDRRLYKNSFVVPDSMIQMSNEAKEKHPVRRTRGLLVPARHRVFRSINLSEVYDLLSQKIGVACKTARTAVVEVQIASPIHAIQSIIEAGLADNGYPFTTLLNSVDDSFISRFGADLTDLHWVQKLSGLDMDTEERVFIYGQMDEGTRLGLQGSHEHDVSTLYQAMADLCVASDEVRAVRLPGLLERAAVQLFLSLISVTVTPRPVVLLDAVSSVAESSLETPRDNHISTMEGVKSQQNPARSSLRSAMDLDMQSSPPDIPAWLGQFSEEKGEASGGADDAAIKVAPEEDEEAEGAETAGEAQVGEDATIARLRQYVVSIGTEPPRTTGKLRLLSHWQLGSDPSQFWWRPVGQKRHGSAIGDEEEQRLEEEEARERRRRRNEKRAARERERMLRMVGGSAVSSGGGGGDGGGGEEMELDMHTSRRRIHHSSQVEPRPAPLPTRASPVPMSSQVFSSQVVASSQVIGSSQPFGHRPKKKLKKKTGGFR